MKMHKHQNPCFKPIARSFFLALVTFAFQPSTFAQGPLNPPGSPAPAMKSLDQVEARIIVNATNTPGTSNALYRITASGSYYLTGDIIGVSGKHGIEIAATNVSLDLNGFSVIGVPGSLIGIEATNGAAYSAAGLRISNGAIAGWGGDGVNTFVAGAPAIFSGLNIKDNHGNGMTALQAVITDCIAHNNTSGYGIQGNQLNIFNCVARANSLGFGLFFGSLLRGSMATGNSTGVDADSGSMVLNNTVRASTTIGINAHNNCRVAGNVVSTSGTGINVAAAGNEIEGNTLVNNSVGGLVLTSASAVRNLIIRNTAQGNGTNYQITASNNAFGPVVNVGGVGDISTAPNSPSTYANYAY